MAKPLSAFRSLAPARRGVALVEFALVLPLFLLLLLGAIAYGQYFLLAHSAQQLANDAARSTVAGVNHAERLALAQTSFAHALAALPEIKAGTAALTIDETAPMVTARVRIDASGLPLFRSSIVPMPNAMIERRAVVRQGDDQ